MKGRTHALWLNRVLESSFFSFDLLPVVPLPGCLLSQTPPQLCISCCVSCYCQDYFSSEHDNCNFPLSHPPLWHRCSRYTSCCCPILSTWLIQESTRVLIPSSLLLAYLELSSFFFYIFYSFLRSTFLLSFIQTLLKISCHLCWSSGCFLGAIINQTLFVTLGQSSKYVKSLRKKYFESINIAQPSDWPHPPTWWTPSCHLQGTDGTAPTLHPPACGTASIRYM